MIINFTKPETGSVLVDIILWLVTISSSIVVGIILFTVILKLITLPFDYFSRASMRRNSLKMEEMRPELEKLQKQYAGDKALYNQKMMALYKKNGYSMFGACLPTILTLVIFIVALNAFTNYSKYQNIKYFYDMSCSYNNVVYSGFDIDNNYIVRNNEGIIVINDQEIYKLDTDINDNEFSEKEVDGKDFSIFVKVSVDEKENKYIEVKTTNSYVSYKRIYQEKDGKLNFSPTVNYTIIKEKLTTDNPLASVENNLLKNEQGKSFKEFIGEETDEAKIETLANSFVLDIQQLMSSKRFREDKTSFIWVKNIWVTDSPMSSPLEENWNTFQTTHEYTGNDIGQAGYESLTAKLTDMKTTSNGYFILVALTAGISLLMQLVMGKSQKAQMELQTVDGQGAQTQKIMMWMMPIMMAIFAFMYTAAFSIYIILSSVISIGTTFGINYIVDKKYKKESKAVEQKNKTVRGRVYVPKQEEKPEPKKEKKVKKETPTQDFLSGLADKKGKKK